MTAAPAIRRLNPRRLVLVLGIAIVFAGGVAGLHRFQVRRNAAALFEQARKAERAGDIRLAIANARRFLAFQPDHPEALAFLARLLADAAQSADEHFEAFLTLNRAIRPGPGYDDLRRRLARSAIAIGRHNEAIEQIAYLQPLNPRDSELCRMMGACQEAVGRFEDALHAYVEAVAIEPTQLDSHRARIRLLQGPLKRPADAKRAVDDMLNSNPHDPETCIAATKSFLNLGADSEARTAIEPMLREAPQNMEVVMTAAQVERRFADAARRTGNHRGARQYDIKARELLDRVLRDRPEEAKAYAAMAELEQISGSRPLAIERLRTGLRQCPNNPQLAWFLADLLLDVSTPAELEEADRLIQSLQAVNYAKPMVQFLVGRQAVRRGNWREAERQLEGLRPYLEGNLRLSARVELELGFVYGALQDVEAQRASLRRAVQIEPFLVSARVAFAAFLAATGDTEQAIQHYSQVFNVPGVPATLIQLLALQELSRPESERRWENIEELKQLAAENGASKEELELIDARLTAARGKLRDSRSILERLLRSNPSNDAARVALADIIRDLEGPRVALEFLQSSAGAGSGPQLRLAVARLTLAVGEHVSRTLEEIEASAEDLNKEERADLLSGLSRLRVSTGDLAGAVRCQQEVTKLRPTNLAEKIALLDLCVRAADDKSALAAIEDIARIDGASGPVTRYSRALRLAHLAAQTDAAALKEAQGLLDAVMRERPNWPPPLRLAGYVAEQSGDRGRAVDLYRLALDHGGGQTDVEQRLIRLLYELGRQNEVAELLERMPSTAARRESKKLLAEFAWREGDRERTLQLALEAVPDDSFDYQDHIWLGRVMVLLKRSEQAEASFRRATERAPERPEPWLHLIRFFVDARQDSKAEHILQEARGKVAREHRWRVVAQGLETLRKIEEARSEYFKAAEQEPAKLDIHRSAAAFEIRQRNTNNAEHHLRQALGFCNDDVRQRFEVRCGLAELLAGYPATYARTSEALQLLDLNEKETYSQSGDQRVRALVLGQRPTAEERRRAVNIWDDLQKNSALSVGDRLRVARLHESLGDWSAARKHFLQLVSDRPDDADIVSAYVATCLRQDALEEAGLWLRRLESLMVLSAQTVELRARWHVLRDETREAMDVISAYSKESKQHSVAALMLERLWEGLREKGKTREAEEAADAAESLYRQLVGDRPEASLRFAWFLGRRGRYEEALRWCDRGRRAPFLGLAMATAVNIIRHAPGNARPLEQVERWIVEALRQQPSDAAILQAHAEVFELQGRYDEAKNIYQRVRELAPESVVAQNNLAWLLAQQPDQRPRAIQLIDAAIDRAGPLPDLLDTRASILLAEGRSIDAIDLLEKVVGVRSRAADWLHLAAAHSATGNTSSARQAIRKAKSLGLQVDSLHPLEQNDARKLLAKLED